MPEICRRSADAGGPHVHGERVALGPHPFGLQRGPLLLGLGQLLPQPIAFALPGGGLLHRGMWGSNTECQRGEGTVKKTEQYFGQGMNVPAGKIIRNHVSDPKQTKKMFWLVT